MTEYVILKSHDPPDGMPDSDRWHEVGRTEARSDTSAIRALNLSDGEYVAVPVRSWRPRAVKAEQTTRLTIT